MVKKCRKRLMRSGDEETKGRAAVLMLIIRFSIAHD